MAVRLMGSRRFQRGVSMVAPIRVQPGTQARRPASAAVEASDLAVGLLVCAGRGGCACVRDARGRRRRPDRVVDVAPSTRSGRRVTWCVSPVAPPPGHASRPSTVAQASGSHGRRAARRGGVLSEGPGPGPPGSPLPSGLCRLVSAVWLSCEPPRLITAMLSQGGDRWPPRLAAPPLPSGPCCLVPAVRSSCEPRRL